MNKLGEIIEGLKEIVGDKLDEWLVRLDMDVVFPMKVRYMRLKNGSYNTCILFFMLLIVSIFVVMNLFALYPKHDEL